MAADDAQAQIAELRARIAELERQKAAELPAAVDLAAPTAPAELAISPAPLPTTAPVEQVIPPASLPVVVPSAPSPLEEDICINLSGQQVPCQKELVDFGELVGGVKSPFQFFDAIQQLDPPSLIGGVVALSVTYVAITKATEWLRPDDAATAQRKREERERLGISEWEQEAESRNARDNVLAAVAILVFEFALFSMRGLIS